MHAHSQPPRTTTRSRKNKFRVFKTTSLRARSRQHVCSKQRDWPGLGTWQRNHLTAPPRPKGRSRRSEHTHKGQRPPRRGWQGTHPAASGCSGTRTLFAPAGLTNSCSTRPSFSLTPSPPHSTLETQQVPTSTARVCVSANKKTCCELCRYRNVLSLSRWLSSLVIIFF